MDKPKEETKEKTILQIMEEFPLMSSWEEYKRWTGFIYTSNTSRPLVRISSFFPNFPLAKGVTWSGEPELLDIFQNMEISTTLRDSKNLTAVEWLHKIRKIIEISKAAGVSSSIKQLPAELNVEFLTIVFEQLEIIGAENVEGTSGDFSDLILKYLDSCGRKHLQRLSIPQKYPKAFVKVTVELPTTTTEPTSWPYTLVDCYKRFKNEVEKFSEFFSVMDDFDQNVRLLDPMQAKRGDCSRRFLLDSFSNVVVTITIRPLAPKSLPDIGFSGPEQRVKEFEALVDKNCEIWSDSLSIHNNLERILELEFSLRAEGGAVLGANGEENEAEIDLESVCVICYSYLYNEECPEVICDCGALYHNQCLADLLVNDCSTKAQRGYVDCPICQMELKVSKAHKAAW